MRRVFVISSFVLMIVLIVVIVPISFGALSPMPSNLTQYYPQASYEYQFRNMMDNLAFSKYSFELALSNNNSSNIQKWGYYLTTTYSTMNQLAPDFGGASAENVVSQLNNALIAKNLTALFNSTDLINARCANCHANYYAQGKIYLYSDSFPNNKTFVVLNNSSSNITFWDYYAGINQALFQFRYDVINQNWNASDKDFVNFSVKYENLQQTCLKCHFQSDLDISLANQFYQKPYVKRKLMIQYYLANRSKGDILYQLSWFQQNFLDKIASLHDMNENAVEAIDIAGNYSRK